MNASASSIAKIPSEFAQLKSIYCYTVTVPGYFVTSGYSGPNATEMSCVAPRNVV